MRDALLGRPHDAGDRDWVVVGATPDEMQRLGFRPVGRDFPVFLHPQTHEEYALARTERKTAPGYHGFVFHASPEVTLEQDLARRDLTINAIAQDEGRPPLVDPLRLASATCSAKVLRHVGPAFAEDPVRILRVARFAARFADFGVAPETMALMRAMVDAGEADALVPERVWQELSRGLMEADAVAHVRGAARCGALARLLPEVDRLWGVPQPPQHHPEVDTGVHMMLVLDAAARLRRPCRCASPALLHDLGKGTTPQTCWPRHIGHEQRSVELAARRVRAPEGAGRVPRAGRCWRRASTATCTAAAIFSAAALVRLLERCDAFRRSRRSSRRCSLANAMRAGALGLEDRPVSAARAAVAGPGGRAHGRRRRGRRDRAGRRQGPWRAHFGRRARGAGRCRRERARRLARGAWCRLAAEAVDRVIVRPCRPPA